MGGRREWADESLGVERERGVRFKLLVVNVVF